MLLLWRATLVFAASSLVGSVVGGSTSRALARPTRSISAAVFRTLALPAIIAVKKTVAVKTFRIEMDGTAQDLIPVNVCEQDKEQLSSRSSESEAARRDLIERVNQLEQDLAASAIQQEQMRGKFNALVANATVTRTERDKLADRVGKLTQDGKHWADTVAQLNSDRDRLMRAEKGAHDENRKLLKAVSHSNAQRQALSKSIAELETVRGQLAVHLASLLGDRAGLSDQVKILTDERNQLYTRHASLLKKRLYCPNKPTTGEMLIWAFVAMWLVASIFAGLDMYRRGEMPRPCDPWRGVQMHLRRREEARLRDETDKSASDTKPSVPAPDGTFPAAPEPASSTFGAPPSPRALDSQVRHCSSRLDLVEGVVSDTARRVGEHDSLLRENIDTTASVSGSADADRRVEANGTDLSFQDSHSDDADSVSSIEVLFALDE